MLEELEDIIHLAIVNNIKCSHIEVSGDGRHFDALIISEEFTNKSRVERHRLVYKALGHKMKDEVHALSLKLFTLNEWEKSNG